MLNIHTVKKGFQDHDNYLWVSIDTHIISVVIGSPPHVPVKS